MRLGRVPVTVFSIVLDTIPSAMLLSGTADRYAIYFLTYEYLKRLLARKGDNDRSSAGITMLKTAISGGVAGMASWLPIYPSERWRKWGLDRPLF